MSQDKKKPICFAQLDIVFPKGAEGMRMSPDHCRQSCRFNTSCLKAALEKDKEKISTERVDQKYHAGKIGFLERWSRRKAYTTKKTAKKK